MIAMMCFGFGVVWAASVSITSLTGSGGTKQGVSALPFHWFAAAAVAQYIGL